MNRAVITAGSNEGFRVAAGTSVIFVDAFHRAYAACMRGRGLRVRDVDRADLILVTHPHWDHFDADEVADVARRTVAKVIGPRAVVQNLRRRLPGETLIEMEPAHRCECQISVPSREGPSISVTAFRTFHGREHNSYLVEVAGFRFFHDGDNEDTRPLPIERLGRVDALLIGPWQGSGWVEFVERLRPERYFLMHLDDGELAAHAEGRFLPEICDRVPPGLVVLRPGESYVFHASSGGS